MSILQSSPPAESFFPVSPAQALIDALEHGGEHKVLRRLVIGDGMTGCVDDISGSLVGIVVDCETSGLDPASDTIIELAMRRFRYDEHGRILKIDRARSWRQDPGHALSAEIVKLTGLTDQDLVGQQIDENAAAMLLRSSDLAFAHNAAFDLKFLERRFPEVSSLAWACSCKEVDWAATGFDGRALGWLVAQCGFFFDGHRAENDVNAVLALLQHTMPDGRSALAELIENSARPTVRFEAIGADFAVKDDLRGRGYRWNAASKVWWREVPEDDRLDEEFWLARQVYAFDKRPRASEPQMTTITARERYA